MSILLVTAHPESTSFSQAVVTLLQQGIQAGGAREAAVADLAAEGFDPRITAQDLAAFRLIAPPPADVLAEQARIEAAQCLVLVFPIHWWSLPALLKGWVDRVFTHGWAYGEGATLAVGPRPPRVRLLAIGAAGETSYDKHGYRQAMLTQIAQGIFGYCGLKDVRMTFLLDVEGEPAVRAAHLAAALEFGKAVAAEVVAEPVGGLV